MLLCLSCIEKDNSKRLRLRVNSPRSSKHAKNSADGTYLVQVGVQLVDPVAGSSVFEEGLSLVRDTFDEARESLNLRLVEVNLLLKDYLFIFQSLDLTSLTF